MVVQLADQRVGLLTSAVAEVQPAARVTPLLGAPALIEGVIDLRGEILPVLNGRRRLGLSPRPVRLTDRLVVLATAVRRLAMHVDAALGLAEVPLVDLSTAASLAPEALQHIGLARLEDGLLVVHDADSFLSADEETDLDEALENFRNRDGHDLG